MHLNNLSLQREAYFFHKHASYFFKLTRYWANITFEDKKSGIKHCKKHNVMLTLGEHL